MRAQANGVVGVGDGLTGLAQLNMRQGPAAERMDVRRLEFQSLVEVVQGRCGRAAQQVCPAPVGE